MPVILARAGMPVSATLRHEDVWQRAPFSMSRYGPNGRDEDQQVVLEVVQPHAQDLRALVGERPDVDVLAVTGHLDQLRGDRVELLVVVRELDLHDAAALAQAVVVLLQAEDVDLAFLLVPVTANALEYRRAVVERVGHYADLGVFQRDDLLLEIGVRRRHVGRAPFERVSNSIFAAREVGQISRIVQTRRLCACATRAKSQARRGRDVAPPGAGGRRRPCGCRWRRGRALNR